MKGLEHRLSTLINIITDKMKSARAELMVR
jgi:hypothetical protein